MARLEGGIFSQPSGNNHGLVFGKARTRGGKKTTVRELVKPSDPQTIAQIAQRSRLSAALLIVQGIGQSVYRFDWNNAVGSLPGFHSLMSRFTDALDETGEDLNPPAATTLGNRHFPEEFSVEIVEDDLVVTWSTETGEIGADDDGVVIIAVQADNPSPEASRTVEIANALREDGTATLAIEAVAPQDVVVGLYFKSTQTGIPSESKLSSARWMYNS